MGEECFNVYLFVPQWSDDTHEQSKVIMLGLVELAGIEPATS